ELKKFADERLGVHGWDQLLARSRLGPRLYLPTQEYPDDQAARLIDAAAAATGLAAKAIMEDFRAFIVPDLLRVYGALLDPSWRTLDGVENTEPMIHRVVRLRDASARPPELHVQRPTPDRVVITYRSHRRMCGVARGIVRGLATHFGETIALEEPSCMLLGA